MTRRIPAPGRVLAATCALFAAGCMSIGREFPAAGVRSLEIGATTQDDARRVFGEPWRTGVDDGQRTWTYARYRYSVFGPPRARDLVLEWDASGVLASYTYNSTEPDLE